MKRWLRYAIAWVLAALFTASPFHSADLSALIPVEAVWICIEDNMVHLETDTGHVGVGRNVSEAIDNLKSTAPGEIFLDTAPYLIVEKDREELVEEMYAILRPSCMVCSAYSVPDMEALVEFLNAHQPKMTLRQWKVDGNALPVLLETEGRFAWRGR